MSKGLFITGTGTDVGKTYISGLILKKLNGSGLSCGYFKAAMSGNVRDDNGKLIPGDAAFVKQISGISQALEDTCPYVYERAVSPHLAARLEGNPVDMKTVKEYYTKAAQSADYLLTEGSGGIICPIRKDEQTIMLEDIIKELSLPCVMVADAGLGTINSVVLTYEYMKARSIPVKGIILNNFHDGDVMEEDNKVMCELLTGLKVIACVGENETDLKTDAQTLAALFE